MSEFYPTTINNKLCKFTYCSDTKLHSSFIYIYYIKTKYIQMHKNKHSHLVKNIKSKV